MWYSYPESNKVFLGNYDLPPSENVTAIWVPGQPPSFIAADFVGLFNTTNSAYQSIRQRYPHAVWDPATGEWLVAIDPARTTDQHNPGSMANSVQQQIEYVRALAKDRIITDDECERRISQILANAQITD
jgi:hypothetical protein